MSHFIKFHPIKPRSPHLNGKVEHSQKTDRAEFYCLLNLCDKFLVLEPLLADWEYFYNHKSGLAAYVVRPRKPHLKFNKLEHLKDITLVEIEVAKNVFQLHGVNKQGKAVLTKRLSRDKLAFIANLPACIIAMEACGSTFIGLGNFKP